jgi:hypothetical protein
MWGGASAIADQAATSRDHHNAKASGLKGSPLAVQQRTVKVPSGRVELLGLLRLHKPSERSTMLQGWRRQPEDK